MLFGSDMTEVTTPDGRRITVPQQLAAQFPGLQPVTQPEIVQPTEPAFAPPSLSPESALAAPVISPSQVAPPSEGARAPRGPITSTREPTGQPNTQPSPRPMTDAQLRGMGNAGVYEQQSQAIGQQQAAVDNQAAVETDEWRKIGEVSAARDEKVEQLLAADAQKAAEHQKFMDGRMADYERGAKDLAAVKVDRSLDHPVLSWIGVALGGIGAAMAGHGADNPALKMLMQGIDRKVAAQMADIDLRKSGLAQQREILGMHREKGRDEQAARDKLKLAALDQAAMTIETIKSKSNSPRAIANADATKAALGVERTKVLENAMGREQTKKQHEDSIREQRAGRAQSASQFQQTFAENVRQFDKREANDLEQAMLAARAKGNEVRAKQIADAQKDNETRGISDPKSGERFMQPDGVKALEQAKKHDATAQQMRAAAEAEQDPGKRQALITRADAEAQRAQDIRVDAAVDPNKSWRVGSPDVAAKLSTQIAATKTIANTVDSIKQLREEHDAKWFLTTEGEAAMQSKGVILTMALKEAWKLGVLSAKDVELLDGATGGDPSKVTWGDITKIYDLAEGPSARLEAVVDGVISGTRDEMRAKGFKGDFRVDRAAVANRTPEEKAAIATLQSKTPVERGRKQERGIAGQVADVATDAFAVAESAVTGNEYLDPGERRARHVISTGSTKYPGLGRDQEASVDAQLSAYRTKSASTKPADKDKAADIGNTLVSIATDGKRPDLQIAVLKTLKGTAPELYERALAKLPANDRGPQDAAPVVNQEDIARRQQFVMTNQPVGLLFQTSLAGDEEAKQELVRRAVAKDKDAIRALSDLVAAKGRR